MITKIKKQLQKLFNFMQNSLKCPNGLLVMLIGIVIILSGLLQIKIFSQTLYLGTDLSLALNSNFELMLYIFIIWIGFGVMGAGIEKILKFNPESE